MSMERIRHSLDQVGAYLRDHKQEALSRDAPATAVLESGLRCRAHGPGGTTLVSDMPAAMGGDGSAPTPGWLLRAALANCDATLIAMRAAQRGILLGKLEVSVSSDSDDRGLLGVAEPVPAGPLSVSVIVRLSAPGASIDALRELVDWAEKHSPVSDAVRRAVPVKTELVVE
jgi:uncharacterized OsmC-like protein